jgi:1-hydroxycarotenoid 3,4-desaturase
MRDRVVIVGAGVAGLVSALLLAARGLQVTLVERGAHPGGKMRQIAIGTRPVDSGPTVFTMRWVFDELFASIGRNFGTLVDLRPLDVLARHAWDAHARLDLFADEERSVAAIGEFAGKGEAARYRSFCRDSRRVYQILEKPFLRAAEPSLGALIGANGFRGLAELPQIRPFSTLWSALGRYFHDPRLRQLFGRYATYCGSSPFNAPATLMLVAHVERAGVWTIDGGMHGLAAALADCAVSLGATIRYEAEAAEADRRGCGDHECRRRSGCERSVRPLCRARRNFDPASRTIAVGAHLEPCCENRRISAQPAFGVLLAQLQGRIRRHLSPRVASVGTHGLYLRAGPRRQ